MIFYCDKGESVFFPNVDKCTQAYFNLCKFSCRKLCCKKKNKAVQDKIRSENAGVTPPPYETATDNTETLEDSQIIGYTDSYESILERVSALDISENTSDEMGRHPENWDSVVKMYGDADTTQYLEATENPKKQKLQKHKQENGKTRCECTKNLIAYQSKSRAPRHKLKKYQNGNEDNDIIYPQSISKNIRHDYDEEVTGIQSPRSQYGTRCECPKRSRSKSRKLQNEKDKGVQSPRSQSKKRRSKKNERAIQFSRAKDIDACLCPNKYKDQKTRPTVLIYESESHHHSRWKSPNRSTEIDENPSPHSRRKQKSHYTSTNNNKVVKENVDLSEGLKKSKKIKHREINDEKLALDKNLNNNVCQCPNVKIEMKPKNTSKRINNDTNKRVKFITGFFADGKCKEGLCVEAAEQRNKTFTCKCNKRRFTATECSNEICKLQPNQPFHKPTQEELDTETKMNKTLRKHFICLCRKYSNKFHRAKTIFVPQNKLLHAKKQDREIKEIKKDATDLQNMPRDKVLKKFNEGKDQNSKDEYKDILIVPRHKIPENVLNIIDPEKEKKDLKKKFICLCRTYSRKIKSHIIQGVEYHIPNYKICDSGICHEAAKTKKEDFVCKCIPVITECTDETCGSDPTQHISETKIVIRKPKRLQSGVKTKDKKQETIVENKLLHSKEVCAQKQICGELQDQAGISITNATDQTGEPFFDLTVDSINMCVLNENEIKNKVKTLGKKKIRCICPSYLRKLEFTPRNVCKSGVCRKSRKNKKTFYRCKCKNDSYCTDLTCNDNPIPTVTGQTEPLFAVNLDSNTMCILNSKEISDKVKERQNQFCLEGKCKSAYKDKDFRCKCVRRKPEHNLITCDNLTCKQCRCHRKTLRGTLDTNNIWDDKSSIKNKDKVKCQGRGSFDTNNIKEITKNIYCVCSRIKSKSENWLCEGMEQRKRLQMDSIHRRGGLRISVRKKAICKECGDPFYPKEIIEKPEDDCICCDCQAGGICTCQKLCKHRLKAFVCNSLSTILNRVRHKDKIRRYSREPVAISYDSAGKKEIRGVGKIPEEDSSDTGLKGTKNKHDINLNNHECQCKKKWKKKKRQLRKKNKREIRKKAREAAKNIDKQFIDRMKKEEKARKKRHKIMDKFRRREVKKLRKEIGAREANCCFDLVMGIVRAVATLAFAILVLIASLIRDPKGSYWYLKKRYKDPWGTWFAIKMWFKQAWEVRKLRIQTTFAGSHTLTVLSDSIQNSPLYQTLAPKGNSKQEQIKIQRERMVLAKRVRKRDNEAIFGCRHIILTTLRHRPCLWFYHLYPNFYPQCLSLVICFRNLCNILMFVLAVFVWTPCLIACELTRAFCCCMLCTH